MDRILYIDIDSLRPDHLGCYGYHRNTSPTIDKLARNGRVYSNVYASDAPCLPSRTAFFSGRFGFHTGVVNHGGSTADPRSLGNNRRFRSDGPFRSLPECFRQLGYSTASISPFPSRHAAWHILDGFETWIDTGGYGEEGAEVIAPAAERWLDEHAAEQGWFLHVNFWDPHIPYDTPLSYGNPFESDPAPEWPDASTIRRHYQSYGPHSAHDLLDFSANPAGPREPSEIANRNDFKQYIDGYDVGIRYMDDHLQRLLDRLKEAGVLSETLIVLSADHGENFGELNVYGDHQLPDVPTCRLPVVVHGPNVTTGVDDGMYYHIDLAATLIDLAGGEVPARWDGQSFARGIRSGSASDRESLVLSQGAHVAGRGVRWDRWLLLRLYDPGVKPLDSTVLFDVETDPYETTDLSDDRPEVAAEGFRLLEEWRSNRLHESVRGDRGGNTAGTETTQDPLWRALQEGGPFHTTGSVDIDAYCARLEATNRSQHVETIRDRYS